MVASLLVDYVLQYAAKGGLRQLSPGSGSPLRTSAISMDMADILHHGLGPAFPNWR
jgi:hypothetical protein